MSSKASNLERNSFGHDTDQFSLDTESQFDERFPLSSSKKNNMNSSGSGDIFGKVKNAWFEGSQQIVEVFLPNKDKYVGAVKNQYYDGEGTYYFKKDDLIYKGKFKNGKQDAETGTLQKGSKVIYEGGWRSGEKHGKGIYYYDGKARFEGVWENGERAAGELISDGVEYRGDWLNNKRDCEDGYLKIANGPTFEGSFSKDCFVRGKITYPNGDIFEGEFSNNERNGKGAYLERDTGARYVGDWENGLKHGEGQIFYANNDNMKCMFDLGRPKTNSSVTYKWANGFVFTGVMIDGKLGAGEFTQPGQEPVYIEDMHKYLYK